MFDQPKLRSRPPQTEIRVKSSKFFEIHWRDRHWLVQLVQPGPVKNTGGMRHVAGMCRSRWWVLRKHVKEISGSAGSRMYAVYWVRCSVHHCRPCTVPLYTPISFGDVYTAARLGCVRV